MKKYQVYFIVEIWDGHESREDAGFVPADSFREAMGYIEEYYGDELSVVKHLELLDVGLLVMTPGKAREVLDELY
jgi:hypothetical protein